MAMVTVTGLQQRRRQRWQVQVLAHPRPPRMVLLLPAVQVPH